MVGRLALSLGRVRGGRTPGLLSLPRVLHLSIRAQQTPANQRDLVETHFIGERQDVLIEQDRCAGYR